MWAVAVAGGLALASFAPGDPSANFASGGMIHNLMGPGGAIVADLLYRLFGWAGLFPVVLLAAWGWRLLAEHRLPVWRFRVAGMPLPGC